ncbi:CARBOXYL METHYLTRANSFERASE putative-RELATED [Salix koriyanagi]|uniref:CARBOXYL METHYLTRANSFERASE putative-RELATED n=1 Tax=Salix koriyanagi TaxID=2511006 RepID=A0A9Q1AF43_9ROSI|nr:CARBOXYL METHYLTRANSFERASE putative-RELATED [Salix koriyanagi]
MATLVNDSILKNDADGPIPVTGGLGTDSYFNHSFFQKIAANVAKDMIEEAITKKLDVKFLLSSSNTIRIADLGCAVGPNTFDAMQSIIDLMISTPSSNLCRPNENTSQLPCRVLFTGDYFPDSSLHVVYSSYALHWLSKVPEDLEDKNSPAWNRGKIHHASAGEEVLRAYAAQWADDLSSFLNARAREIVPGGIVVIVTHSIPDGMEYSELANGMMYNCMASILLDIAKRGLITEEQVDAFNLPTYAASPGEFVSVVENNEYFNIVTMGESNPSPWLTDDVHVDMNEFVSHIRAAMEGMFSKHFSREIVNEMFEQLEARLSEISVEMESAYKDKIQAFYVLQRNDSG